MKNNIVHGNSVECKPNVSPAVAKASAERYVELLAGSADAKVHWRVLSDQGNHFAKNLDGALRNVASQLHHFQLDEAGVFMIVNGGGHKDMFINDVRAVFVDMDDGPLPDEWHEDPDFLVVRDETHWHAYWLTDGFTVEQFTEVQRRLSKFYKTDPSVCNASRVMRVPGFLHQKGEPIRVTLDDVRAEGLSGSEIKRRDYDTLTAFLPELTEAEAAGSDSKANPKRFIPPAEGEDLPSNIEKAERYLAGRERAKANPGGRGLNGPEKVGGNTWTFQTACGIRDFGISAAMCAQILYQSEWNAKSEPPWGIDELTVENGPVDNAYDYAKNRSGQKANALLKTGRLKEIAVPVDEYVPTSYPTNSAKMMNGAEEDATELSEVNDNIPDVDAPDSDDSPGPVDLAVADIKRTRAGAKTLPFWMDVNDFATVDRVREYLVKNWLIAHGVTAILAKRGAGKSTLALDLAMCVAKDTDWWGLPVMEGWKVVYICGEDDEGMILNVRAWGQYEGRGLPDKERFLVATNIIKMTNEQEVADRIREIAEWAGDSRVLVVLDTWARSVVGHNSNAQEEMDTAYENAEKMAKAFSGPMLALFHPPKDGKELTIRGSAVQEDASSGIWEIIEETDGIKLTIGRAKGKGRNNYRKFRLLPVELPGTDFYGDPLEGIVPVKFGGTEDSAAEKRDDAANKLATWANIIRIAIDQKYRAADAVDFKPTHSATAQWLASVMKDPSMMYHDEIRAVAPGVTAWSESTIKRTLKELFFPETGRTPIYDFPTDDDGENLRLIIKGKGRSAYFEIINTPASTVRNRAACSN